MRVTDRPGSTGSVWLVPDDIAIMSDDAFHTLCQPRAAGEWLEVPVQQNGTPSQWQLENELGRASESLALTAQLADEWQLECEVQIANGRGAHEPEAASAPLPVRVCGGGGDGGDNAESDAARITIVNQLQVETKYALALAMHAHGGRDARRHSHGQDPLSSDTEAGTSCRRVTRSQAQAPALGLTAAPQADSSDEPEAGSREPHDHDGSLNPTSPQNAAMMHHDDETAARRRPRARVRPAPPSTKARMVAHYRSARHARWKHPIRVLDYYECSQCGYRSKTKSHVERHINAHNDHRPFKCTSALSECGCGQGFITERELQHHIMAQRDERRYACPMCDRRFTQNCHCLRHQRLHCPVRR